MWFLDGQSPQDLRERTGALAQVAGIGRYCEEDGPARGSRRYQVRTGSGLAFDVLPDRGLDLAAATFRGVPLTWTSPAGHVAPAMAEHGDSAWLRAFPGGLLTTCGLDQFGAANTDQGADFELHGRASTTPAREVNTRQEPTSDGYRFEVAGTVRQTRLFGENLALRRVIGTELGSRGITVTDTVSNEGFAPQPHMLLYHMNLGWPLIDEGASLRVPGSTPVPRDEVAERGLPEWDRIIGPQAGFAEQVFRHEFGTAGMAEVRVSNPHLALTLRIRFDTAELPGLFQWKLLDAGSYVLGIEPANCPVIHGRAAARAAGELPVLQPGHSRSYSVRVEVEPGCGPDC